MTLNSGRTVSRRVDDMPGLGGENPMSGDELWAKFDDCACRVLPKQEIMPLFERLETLENVRDVADLTRMMARRAAPGTGQPRPVPAAAPSAQGNTLLETSWMP